MFIKKILSKNIIFSTIKGIKNILLPNHKRLVIILFLLVFVGAIFEVIGLALVLPVINIAIHPSIVENNQIIHFLFSIFGFESPKNFTFFLFFLVLFFFVLKNVLSLFISYYQNYYTSIIGGEIGHNLFKRYYNRDIRFFNNLNSFELLRNVTSIPNDFVSNILIPLILFFNESLVVLIISVTVAIYNYQIFLLLLVTIIPSFFFIFKYTKTKIVQSSLNRKEEYLQINKRAGDSINGYIDIKLLNKQQYFFDEYLHNQQKMAKSNATIFSINQTSSKAIEIVSILCIFLVLTIAMLKYNNQQGLLNIMTFFLVASYRLLPSLNKMIISLNNIKGFQYVFGILNEFKDDIVVDEKLENSPLKFSENLELNNLSFRYETGNKTILKNFSFTINKGETIGIIGVSGSGKTTLINIILGFLKPIEGNIKLDNQLIDSSNLAGWRNLIGYVKQNVFILDGNIWQNIAIGVDEKDVDFEKINKALQTTKMDTFVNNLSDGLNTHIGQQGSKLSGGQKQRIAIARALYHDAQILVFDEATSALDNETEKEITDAIENLLGSKTMIIVAHRYSTLKNCSKIIEMKDGKIENILTYQQLIESKL